MIRNKRLLSLLVLLLVSVALIFTGCGKTYEFDGTITIAVDDTYPPMEFRDENNNLVGFDVDLATLLCQEMGYPYEFKSVAWDGIFDGLKAGNYDVIISSVSMDTDRMKTMDFTKPYLANGQVIVVKAGDTSINTRDDLAGKIVGVQVSTTSDTACTKQLEKTKFELKRFDEIIQTFDALAAGHIECIVVDYPVAIEYQSKNPDKFAITSAQLTNEPIACCFAKGNPLRNEMQKALDKIRADGRLAELSKKWFNGVDYTSNIDENLY
jgi:polar amino acid transport system substrate-binding protein